MSLIHKHWFRVIIHKLTRAKSYGSGILAPRNTRPKRLSLAFMAGLLVLSLITSSGATMLLQKEAAAAPSNPMTNAKSWLYYEAMSFCINSNNFAGVRSPDEIRSGQWFSGNMAPTIAYFLKGAGVSYESDTSLLGNAGDSVAKCNGGWVQDAASVWGYSSALDLACDIGIARVDSGQSCRDGDGNLAIPGASWLPSPLNIDTFQSTIKNRVYDGNSPSTTNEAMYYFYKNVFFGGCLSNTAPYAGSTDDYTYTIGIVNPDGTITPTRYHGIKKQDESIEHSTTAGGSILKDTCGDIARVLREDGDYATAYATWAKKNRGEAEEIEQGTEATPGTTTCDIDGVGWIVCPVMNFLGSLADGAYSALDGFLRTDPELVKTDGPAHNAWKSMRNIANVAFIIAFFVIIFSQITSFGIDNYGIKKMLPRLIIAVILVNLSFYICQIAVDLSNILGYSLKDVLENIGQTNNEIRNSTLASWAGVIEGAVAGTTIVAVGVMALLAISFSTLIAALLAVLITILILMARLALIVILTVISPLAFVAFLLPNTESLFKKWGNMFIGLLLVFPMIAVVYGGASFAARVINNSANGDALIQITALCVAALPLALTPMLLKGSLNATGKIGATVAGFASKRYGALGSAVKDKSNLGQIAQYQQQQSALRRAKTRSGVNPRRGGRANPLNWSAGLSRQLNPRLGGYGAAQITMGDELEAKDIGLMEKAMDRANLGNSKILEIALGGKADGFDGKRQSTQQAAIKRIMASGTYQQMEDVVNAHAGNKNASVRNTMVNSLAASSNKPAWAGGGALDEMRSGRDANGNSLAGIDGSKNEWSNRYKKKALLSNAYSSQKIATGDNDELNSMAAYAAAVARDPGVDPGVINGVIRFSDNANTALKDNRLNVQITKNAPAVNAIADLTKHD